MSHAKAYAKINLALVVGPLRDDGKHEVVTVLQRIDLHDDVALESSDGLVVEGFPDDTIVRRALESLARALDSIRTGACGSISASRSPPGSVVGARMRRLPSRWPTRRSTRRFRSMSSTASRQRSGRMSRFSSMPDRSSVLATGPSLLPLTFRPTTTSS